MSAEAWDMNIDKIRLAEVTKDTGRHSQNIEACQEIERLSRTMEARRHRIHVGIVGAKPEDHVSADGLVKIRDVRVDELAALMKWTPEWARQQVNISRVLVVRLPDILNRLEAGEISDRKSTRLNSSH